MQIGIAYDLRDEYLAEGYSLDETAELDSEETILGLEAALHCLGHTTERIGHLRSLIRLLNAGRRWDLVFNICEGMHGTGREAQVPALLDAYQIPYTFSDPLVLALTLHKGLTKRVIRDAGLPTAPFTIVERADEAGLCPLPFPVFIKPVAEGSGKGIDGNSIIYTAADYTSHCLQLLEKYRQQVLVEKLLTGREFTVGITGTGQDARVVGVMEVLIRKEAEEQTYSRFIKENYESRVNYHLVDGPLAMACSEVSLKVWRLLGCRDAGRVDLKLDENGKPNFLEVNPLAGLNHRYSDLPILTRLAGRDFSWLIREIVLSAVKRQKILQPA